jgi:hypothetical protein
VPIARTHAAERTAAKLLTGADLLFAVGSYGLHYHLWASLGYRHLLTIGPLFVVPAVVGMVLAVRAGTFGKPLLLAAEAGFAPAVRGRYVLCRQAERTILVRPS